MSAEERRRAETRVLDAAALPTTRRAFDPAKHCGAQRQSDDLPGPRMSHGRARLRDGGGKGEPCRLPKGWGTDHLGYGTCRKHRGSTPNAERAAAKEAAVSALHRLGVPSGTGDPFDLLAKAVAHAEGHLEATAALVREAAAAASSAAAANQVVMALEAAADLYEVAIRDAARVGKAAVDADVADRRAVLIEQQAQAIYEVVTRVLDWLGISGEQRDGAQAVAVASLEEYARVDVLVGRELRN